MTRSRKQGRPRKGDELLTRERILRTALQLVDAHGIEAFSMRRLAAALGVDPMAIYHYLPGKEAVLEGITQLAFSELRVEPCAEGDWRDQVRAFARGYRDLVRTHPHLTMLLIANVEAGGASVLEANERLYQALERSGLPPAWIPTAAAVIVDYVHGFALSEGLALQAGRSRHRQGGEKDDVADLKREGREGDLRRDAGETRAPGVALAREASAAPGAPAPSEVSAAPAPSKVSAAPAGLTGLLERYPSLSLPALRRALAPSATVHTAVDLEAGIELILAGIEAMIPPRVP